MSRIGKQPIKIPQGCSIKLENNIISVTSSKGSLKRDTFGRIELKIDNDILNVFSNESKYWGLYRTLVDNMVTGVTSGYSKTLELQGTGYKANLSGKSINLSVGLSHQVIIDPPNGIDFEVDKSGKIKISGCDKELVGQISAKIRSIRPPEPYHGKGIRYAGELVRTKVGKSATKK